MVGSGFNAKFHLLAFVGVRDADVLGVWSPNQRNAAETAGIAKKLGVGDAKPYPSIAAMVEDPAIDALWLSGPNFARIENAEEIVSTIERGKGSLLGVACEKPLARNAGEEHSGPHGPWFWQGALQGGGVLNDMMCHSSLLVQHLLTDPAKPRSTVRPSRITAHIASLKWTRPAYSKKLAATMGKEVNYDKSPAEDFASVVIEFATDDGHRVIGEATTSWSFVGPGLRLSAELLGPEYSLSWNSLDSGLNLFFSREVQGKAGEDLVEKQNAEMGQMPVVASEAAAYGYEAEDRHFVRVFLDKERPALTFDDGLEVVKVLMTAYQSAEQGRTLDFPPEGIDSFVPAVAKGTWKP